MSDIDQHVLDVLNEMFALRINYLNTNNEEQIKHHWILMWIYPNILQFPESQYTNVKQVTELTLLTLEHLAKGTRIESGLLLHSQLIAISLLNRDIKEGIQQIDGVFKVDSIRLFKTERPIIGNDRNLYKSYSDNEQDVYLEILTGQYEISLKQLVETVRVFLN